MSSNIARGYISRAGIILSQGLQLRVLIEGGSYMRKCKLCQCGLNSQGISISSYPQKNVQNRCSLNFQIKVKNWGTVFFSSFWRIGPIWNYFLRLATFTFQLISKGSTIGIYLSIQIFEFLISSFFLNLSTWFVAQNKLSTHLHNHVDWNFKSVL